MFVPAGELLCFGPICCVESKFISFQLELAVPTYTNSNSTISKLLAYFMWELIQQEAAGSIIEKESFLFSCFSRR